MSLIERTSIRFNQRWPTISSLFFGTFLISAIIGLVILFSAFPELGKLLLHYAFIAIAFIVAGVFAITVAIAVFIIISGIVLFIYEMINELRGKE